MDDLQYGTRDKRGNWAPNAPNQVAPIWRFPWRGADMLGFLKGYFLPWNLAWMAIAAVYWFFLTPSVETLSTFSFGWIALLYLRNSAAVLIFYGAMEFRLYMRRRQGTAFKYNGQFPADKPSDVFWFRNQIVDGIVRTFLTGVPIWTAVEAVILWCYANGIGSWTTLSEHPVALIVLWLLIPFWHETHFFCIHRLIHVPVLYKHIHSVHHNSINPSPWSSLSMHPVEQFLFFSAAFLHLIVLSHPMIGLYSLNWSGMGAIVGHIGFDRIVSRDDERSMETHAYTHYLHHKYFEVNYGDALIPFDKIFGTWHDGTPASDARLRERMKKRREQRAAGKAA